MAVRRNLPSIKALVTFEAAMRLKSFTGAARELNVTQAAVSRQVRVLEDLLGCSLFVRGHRRVEPTVQGAKLGLVLTQSLDLMTEGVEDLRRSQAGQSLTVGATLAISYFFLLPRLSRFREIHPGLKIRLLSQDEPFDLRSSGLDLVIRYGHPPFADGRTLISREDACFPVCAPSVAERLPRNMAPVELLSLPLIGHDAADPTWMLWPDWFEAAGVGRRTPSPALQFNHYADGIAAALAGQGVMLGWEMILHDHLAKGQLVRIGAKVKANATYNVIMPLKRANPAAEAFADWIGGLFEETLASRGTLAEA